MENFNFNVYLKQLRTMYFAMIGMPILIGIVFLFIYGQTQNQTNEDTLFILGPAGFVFSVSALVISIFIPPKILKNQLKHDMILSQKLFLYRSNFIIKLALAEAAALVYIPLFISTQSQFFLILFLVSAALMTFIVRPPSAEKIIETLKLAPEEIKQLH